MIGLKKRYGGYDMLTIPIDSNLSAPLYEQIYCYIKTEIKTKKISIHEKLPSTRKLAKDLGVSRNTIEMAYDQLLSEGYIEVFPKRGYFVNELSNVTYLSIDPIRFEEPKAIEQTYYNYDFSPFTIDNETFPYNIWRRLSKDCLNNQTDLFLLGENQGDYPLRKAIADYLHQSRGVACSPKQVIVGAGIDYLIQLLCQLFPHYTVIGMENPSYIRAYRIFKGLGFLVSPISLDQNGMDIKALSASNASIAYVTPSHQYPLGVITSINRRLELLDWAMKAQNRYIIEDDHDSEFRYKGKPIPALQGIDANNKVIYLGTFSKAIAPAIRIGYMVLPIPLLSLYEKKISYYACTVSRVDQAIMTKFITEGYFERHLNRMRTHYKAKQDAAILAFREFGNSIKILGEHAGLHFVLQFRTYCSEKELIDIAKQHKIALYGLSEHFIHPPEYPSNKILFGYANLSIFELTKGIHELYCALKQVLY